MGERFGKYGDLKRRKALQRGRREKSKLERANLTAQRSRRELFPLKQRFSSLRAAKSYKTAAVAIPPDHLWGRSKGCASSMTGIIGAGCHTSLSFIPSGQSRSLSR